MCSDPYATAIPGTVYGVVLNFRADLHGLTGQLSQPPYMAPPRAPVLYIKPANTWVADGGVVALPAGADGSAGVQVAATLGLVVGTVAARVSPDEALAHVSALRVVNDLTLPHESVYRPAIRQRCRDGFCPIGPAVPRSGLQAYFAGCRLRTCINGVLQHEWSTAELVRGPAQLLADVSEFMTLWPGDVLMLGTPRSAPVAHAGDLIRIEAPGVGALQNSLVATPGAV